MAAFPKVVFLTGATTLTITTFSIMTLTRNTQHYCTKHYYSFVVLSVTSKPLMLSVFVLSVVAPFTFIQQIIRRVVVLTQQPFKAREIKSKRRCKSIRVFAIFVCRFEKGHFRGYKFGHSFYFASQSIY